MIFMDKVFWTEKLPAYQLLKTMAKGKTYEKLIYLCDEPDEAIDALLSFFHMKKPLLKRLSTAPTMNKGK
jgi:hypothetical protein